MDIYTCRSCGRDVPESNRMVHETRCVPVANLVTVPPNAAEAAVGDSTLLAPQEGWVCAVCTLHNAGGNICSACDTRRGEAYNPQTLSEDGAIQGESSSNSTSAEMWDCEHCTFQNNPSEHTCAACLNQRVRPPDASFRDRLVPDSSHSRDSLGASATYDAPSSSGLGVPSSDDGDAFSRLLGGAMLGGVLGGAAALLGGNSRGALRMAVEGASLGALTSALITETNMSVGMQHSSSRQPRITRRVFTTGHPRPGREALEFEDMLRLFFSSQTTDVDSMSYEQLLERFGAGRERLRGADSGTIARLPSRTLDSDDVDENGEPNSCSICLEPFRKGDRCTTLPCEHIYHTSCITEWLSNVNTCPVCKHEI